MASMFEDALLEYGSIEGEEDEEDFFESETLEDEPTLISGLNPAQQEAVNYIIDDSDDPVQIIAGAGSGKTRTIIAATKELVQRSLPAHKILIVAFTRKAANEANSRIQRELGDLGQGLKATTLHSLCWGFLRSATTNPRYSRLLGSDTSGFPYAAKVCGFRSASQIIKSILKAGGPTKRSKVDGVWQDVRIKDENGTDIRFCVGLDMEDADPRAYQLGIMLLHAGCIDVTASDQAIREHCARLQDETVLDHLPYVFRAYEKAKQRLGIIGFEDMLTLFRQEILEHPERLKSFQDRYSVIFVDEAQDLNKIQTEIVIGLATRKRTKQLGKLVMVGDEGQCIYMFNGARPELFREFGNDPRVRRACLNINYRSTRTIVEMGQRVCEKNPLQLKYDMKWVHPEDLCQTPAIQKFVDPLEEAGVIADRISRMISEGHSPGEFVCLSRVNAWLGPVTVELLSRGIKAVSPKSVAFFEIARVKQCLAYLSAVLALQEGKPVSGADIAIAAEFPRRGLGEGFIAPMRNWKNCALNGCSYLARQNPRYKGANDLAALIRKAAFDGRNYPNNLQKAWEIIQSSITVALEEKSKSRTDDEDDDDTFLIFCQIVEGFHKTDIQSLLQLAAESQKSVVEDNAKPAGSVIVSTVHRFKGGEAEDVSVLGLGEGLFPHRKALSLEGGLEEERRLFYVAITRAKVRLHLSWPGLVYHKPCEPSRFLEEALASGEGLEEFLKIRGN